MKRTRVKLLTALFLFAAFLFVQDAQAQSFEGDDVVRLSTKAGVDPADFVGNDPAAIILKVEIEALNTAAANLNGGTAEATNSLTSGFYMLILDRLETSDTVLDAVRASYANLIDHASKMSVGVNVDAIIDGTIDLLSN